MRKLRGDDMSMIFQDPLSSMHPFYRVGDQIREAYLVHNDVAKKAAQRRPRCSGAWAYRTGKPVQRLPAPVLRRNASASHDCHGADLQPEAADR